MTRLAVSLDRFGGWGEHTITLPDTPAGWQDDFTGRPSAPARSASPTS